MLIFGSVTLSLRGFVLKSFAELDNDFLLMAGPSTRHFYSISQPFFYVETCQSHENLSLE